ncbi:MAG: DUF72 domain-containing protein [Planctomycetota bacterium]
MPEDRPRPQQQFLFGPPDPQPGPGQDDGPVRPAPVDADVQALAARLPSALRLGTSSWSFAGWNGLVYAAGTRANRLARDGLGAYAQHPLLRTVGVDRTFYAPIDRSEFAAYAAAVPADFRFLVKAWSECTTPRRRDGGANPRYLHVDTLIEHVLTPAALGLGDALGPLLLQFPPQGPAITRAPDAFADRLHAFLAALPRGVAWHVDLRDRELLTARYAAALQDASAHHCYSLHPRLPELDRQRELVPPTGPVLVRWMLHQGLGYDEAKARYQPFDRLVDPDPPRRAAIVALCADALRRQLPVTVVVNNKAEGSAPRSLLELARALLAEPDDSMPR